MIECLRLLRNVGQFDAISAFLLDCEIAFVVADSPEDVRTLEGKPIQTLRPS